MKQTTLRSKRESPGWKISEQEKRDSKEKDGKEGKKRGMIGQRMEDIQVDFTKPLLL